VLAAQKSVSMLRRLESIKQSKTSSDSTALCQLRIVYDYSSDPSLDLDVLLLYSCPSKKLSLLCAFVARCSCSSSLLPDGCFLLLLHHCNSIASFDPSFALALCFRILYVDARLRRVVLFWLLEGVVLDPVVAEDSTALLFALGTACFLFLLIFMLVVETNIAAERRHVFCSIHIIYDSIGDPVVLKSVVET